MIQILDEITAAQTDVIADLILAAAKARLDRAIPGELEAAIEIFHERNRALSASAILRVFPRQHRPVRLRR